MMQHLLVFLSITISPKDRRINKCKKKAPQEDKPRIDSLKTAFKSSATELNPASKYVQAADILMETAQFTAALKTRKAF